MAEDSLEQLANQIRKYMEFARRVMRRWWIIGLLTTIGAGASVAAALMMTRYYESRTLIAYKDAVDKDRVFSGEEHRRAENWLRTRLEETFSSHTLRMEIIMDMDLFPSMRDSTAPEVLLEEFSRKLKFDTVGSDSFWISYEYNDPHKAQQAAARLAEEFIRRSIEAKLFAAQSTLTFMEREVKKSKSDMEQIENEMAIFTSEHPEYQIDPTTGMPRSPSMGTAPSENFANISNPELRRALTKKGKLEAQLQLLLNPQGNAKVTQARQEVDRAKKRLITLRQQYTDRHPDVQRALIYARQVQTQYNTIIQAQQGNSAGSIARLRDEIASMDQSIARLSARKRPKNETKDAPVTPQVSRKAQLEMRFYQLTRDREVAKAKYDQLYTQLTKTKVSASLERKQAETQFTIVDKANLPRKPSRPSRTKLALGGTALGLMLGLGLAVLLVIFDPRIYSEDDLKKACDLPVLAQIPREA